MCNRCYRYAIDIFAFLTGSAGNKGIKIYIFRKRELGAQTVAGRIYACLRYTEIDGYLIGSMFEEEKHTEKFIVLSQFRELLL